MLIRTNSHYCTMKVLPRINEICITKYEFLCLPTKKTNVHYLLLNITIIALHNGKISLIFLWGMLNPPPPPPSKKKKKKIQADLKIWQFEVWVKFRPVFCRSEIQTWVFQKLYIVFKLEMYMLPNLWNLPNYS